MSNLRIWTGIPHGSRFELSVNPIPDASVVAGARILQGNGHEEQWTDPELQPGPKIFQPIRRKQVYSVRVRVQFLTAGQAEIRAVVRKPGGEPYGDPYVYRFNGEAGDVVRATIGLVGIKS